ncbi:MAG: prepilin peptidase [Bryobacterales bacterium]|nr:prepilin peptidase [Bryobacterales bacterium]
MNDLWHLQILVAVTLGLAASAEDLFRRTISNYWSLSALVAGIVLHAWHFGWRGLVSALAGAVAGFAVFLVFYLLGGMGGGDIKLMAGFGSLVGISQLLVFAFWTALVGGFVAALVLAVNSFLRTANKRPSIPYAPAIAAGVCLALVSA